MSVEELTQYEKGQAFIKKLLSAFKGEGYEVFTTVHRAGPDILAKKDGKLYLIEAKSIWTEKGRNIIFRKYQLTYLVKISEFLGATPLIVLSHKRINSGELRVIYSVEKILSIVTHLNPAMAENQSITLKKWFALNPFFLPLPPFQPMA